MTSKTDKPAEVAVQADPVTGEVLPLGVSPLQAATAYGLPYRVSDLIPSLVEWDEFERIDIRDYLDTDLIWRDVQFLVSNDFVDESGQPSEYGVALVQFPGDDQLFTTLVSGVVVMRKMHQIRDYQLPDGRVGAFPIAGQIRERPSQHRRGASYFEWV